MKAFPFTIVAFLFVGFKAAAQIQGFPNSRKVVEYERFYTIDYNLPDKNQYTEKIVEDKDSIQKMQAEFRKIVADMTETNLDTKIDTISKYRLRFINEFYTSENIGRASSQSSLLKKCDQPMNLKSFVDRLKLVNSYSKKYVVVFYMAPVDIGNTYTRSGTITYYFEKID